MKNRMITTAIAFALVIAGATAGTNPIKTKKVNTTKSNITWVGKKVLGSHTGTIALQSGELIMDGTEITGGNFVVDMSTINVTDLEPGKGKEKLEGHLNSDDFFGVDQYPTATFEITQAAKSGDGYSVLGNMTIKGVTRPIKFILKLDGDTATTTFKIDRTKYGIRYGSSSFIDNLKDNAINDQFELTVNLVF